MTPDPDPDPPTPIEPTYAVANQKSNYGFYSGGILKVDGVLVDTYGTLTDGNTNTWNVSNLDDPMGQRYFTPGFLLSSNTVYLQVYVNTFLYRFNGSTWECVNGTTDADVVASIVGNSNPMGLSSSLLALFVDGSLEL